MSVEILGCAIKGIYGIIYRSPSYKVDDTIERFDCFFDETINVRKFNLIMGDVNVDMNKEKSLSAKKLTQIFDKYGLTQCVNFNTRITEKSETKIDVILTNKCDKICCVPLLSYRISDHESIKIDIMSDSQNIVECEKVMSWRNYTKESMIENLRKCEWTNFSNSDIDAKVNLLRNNLKTAVAPLIKEVKINLNMRPKKWFLSMEK